ncbi:MAG TPA: glycosyltransferase family 2 protein [Terracidiphilus sp.]|nr:glycosyltransferase family 2 protein [Terracidiphilus sp.]
MPIHKAAVLITSHNRRELTLAALATLYRQRMVGDLETEIILVDDACTDGTGQAVRSRFPGVHVLQGNGSLYWNGGMRLAFAVAMNMQFDAYVFMNDDTMLYKDALGRLVSLARERLAAGTPAIVAGSTRSPRTGKQSYGGLIRCAHGPFFDLRMVDSHPSDSRSCDTMNGNFVLVPAEIAAAIGNLDQGFQHQFGDLDYGLRAKQAGFDIVLMPGYAGDCSDHPVEGTWRDQSLAFIQRWHHLTSPKGVPFKEWMRFTQRHFGWRFPLYACSPYLKTIAAGVIRKPRNKTSDVLQEGLSCEG